jgi:hypothetical protein
MISDLKVSVLIPTLNNSGITRQLLVGKSGVAE